MIKALRPSDKTTREFLNMLFQRHYLFFLKEYKKPPKAIIPKQAFVSTNNKPRDHAPCNNDQKILQDIESVVDYHRDIHWILPGLFSWIQQKQLPGSLERPMTPFLTGVFLSKEQKNKALSVLAKLKKWIEENQ